MLRGAAVSLIALSPILSLSSFSGCLFVLFFSFVYFLSQPNTPFSAQLFFFCNLNYNERKSTIPDRHFTVEDYSLDKTVFGSIHRQEVPLEAALQITDYFH